jgi:long-chain acyl-CoA synthetase
MAFVGDRLERLAKEHPGRAALRCGPNRLCRRELFQALEAAAFGLAGRTRRGGRVVLRQRDPVALLICFFACARSGRVATVMDPDWPQAQVTAVLDRIAPDLVVDDDSFAALSASDASAGSRYAPDRTPSGPDDLFYAGFTSGSSGTPKGYVRSHGSWLESFRLSSAAFGLSPHDRIVIAGQLTHSLHLYGAVCGLAEGHEVVLMPRFDPRSILADLGETAGGSILYATPTQLHYLAEAARRTGPVDTVKQVLSSGAKWRDADRDALKAVFPHARLFEFYGASETSFITIATPGDIVPAGSVGRAADGVEIFIGDPGDPFPAERSGPIWVRSRMLFHGYICGSAPDTRWQDGWLTVGDHGYVDENGFLYLTGRENRMIVTSGLNVYPEEIEAVLDSHPAVAASVVVGLPDAVRGERLEAVVQLKRPLDNPQEKLTRHCRARLAAGKTPRGIHVRDALPLTAGGKPDIQGLVADLLAGGGEG